MADKVVLSNLASLQNETAATNTINQNMDRIKTAINNTLSRDGTGPNALLVNIDMNSHRILNLPEPIDDTEPLRLGDVDIAAIEQAVIDSAASADAAADSQAAAASSETNAAASAAAALVSENNADTSEAAAAASAAAAAASSVNPALQYTFTNPTTDSDPGPGNFKLNNATAGSATQGYFDNLDANGNTVTAWWDALDDSTNTVKGQLYIHDVTAPTAFYVYNVTGSIVDGTGYRKVTLTNVVNGGGTLADSCVIWFSRAGDSASLDFNAIAADTINSSTDLLVFGDASDSFNANTTTITNFKTNAAVASSGANTDITSVYLDNTGLKVKDTNASHGLTIKPGSDITADRILTLSTGDAARTVTISADATISQDYSTTGNPQFATIELGAASDTTISRSAAGVIAVEAVPLYPNTPVNSQSTAYTTVLADAQKFLLHPTADNNARTFTIDSNANVAYPVGTTITFINQINTLTIAITSDTMVLAGPGSTGSRTLAAKGVATAIKVATTEWYITGTGLS